MSWLKRPAESTRSPQLKQSQEPEKDTEKRLAEELSKYEREYHERIKGKANQDAADAKSIVAKARDFVSNSRLGYALAQALLEHIRYWPSWSARDNFSTYVADPFGYVGGSISRDKNSATTVIFTYNNREYTLKFVDNGINQRAFDDMNSYGTIELIYNHTTVLGLDIAKKLNIEHDYWKMNNVFALNPGQWMKDLIEMAAYIDAQRQKRINSFSDQDALDRASKIKLPE